MKRALAVLLCILLLLPTVSTVAWAASGAYTPLVTIPYAYNGTRTVDSRNEIFSYGVTFDPVDLTAFGYPASGSIPAGKLGLQLDVCVSGTADVVAAMGNGQVTGQLELTSSGTCDVEETAVSAARLDWQANAWSRTVIDLADFGRAGGTFDPTALDYMRIYVGVPATCTYQAACIKVANVQIVDLTAPLDTAPALGDGTAGDEKPTTDNPYTAPGYKELAAFPYAAATLAAASGEVFASSGDAVEGIDLTQWGYPASGLPEEGKLGIQLDYYIDGGENAVKLLENGMLNGQMELTSSGTCDKNEHGLVLYRRLQGKAQTWTRNVLDLAWFTTVTGGALDPTNWNYMRLYFSLGSNFPDERVEIRVCNVRLVDLTQPLTSEEATPPANGAFAADPPQYAVQNPAPEFVTDTAVVAGYNLMTYAEEHGLLPVEDWSPVIQSLLYGLSTNGGGMLYIPAGIYPCYSEIILPTGCTLQGDWVNPDTRAAGEGTVLAVYADTATFVTMCSNSYLRSMAFWYPEQTAESPKTYPYTIQMGTTTHLKDITLVNSYGGIRFNGGSCPDMENIYGTPLMVGMDIDMCTDSYGMENVNFAPDYWVDSGLPKAPLTYAEKKALTDWLYTNATGLVVRRMDWSWTTYSTIKGYAVGVHFAKSGGGDWYPNGQCYNLTLEDCHTALRADNVGGAGMVLNGFTVKNCEYGILSLGNARLHVIDADIDADTALLAEGKSGYISVLSSVIRRGTVTAKGGRLTVLDTAFTTAAPQVTLTLGTQAALFAAATDANGNRITVDNKAYCLLVQEDENPITEEMPVISREEGLYQHHRPASSAVTVAELDNTGATDVSEALNALLLAQAATGGTVFLKPGFYRLDNPITVPTGVELLGSLDFGQAELYNGVGSILQIYHGKNQPDAATIILEAGAGLRGVQINYPEQNVQADGSFVPYAHTVQGRGDGAYVINVSSRNSWSGVDFMTHRCDNHYIDSFRGNALTSFVAVGGGAENGIVRNCHLQYTSWTYGDNGTRGGWPRVVDGDNDAREAWRMDLYAYAAHNLYCYTIGHVENQLHFGNMNYCGYTGIHVVPEDTGLADVTVWGQNSDYCTVSMNVEAAKRVDFINLQTTAFSRVPDRQVAEMNLIHLGADCDTTVNVFGAALYENPDYMFDVENGTLNIYGAVYKSSVPMTNMAAGGKIHLVDMSFEWYDSAFDDLPQPSELTTAVQNPQNLTIAYSYHAKPLTGMDTLGRVQHVYLSTTQTRVDVAENMTVPQGAEVLYSEAFTDYATAASSLKLGTVGSTVTITDGIATLQNTGSVTQTGLTATSKLSLATGANYRLEMRLKADSFRTSYGGRLSFNVYNQSSTALNLWRINNSATLQVKNGYSWTNVGTLSLGEWYRISVELTMQTSGACTYRVTVYDARYRTVMTSSAYSLNATAVTGWQLLAETTLTSGSGQTQAQLDYLAVMRGGAVEEDVSHTAVTVPATPPTCTVDGVSEGVYCRICGEVLTAPQTLTATGHTAVEDAAAALTCTTDGMTAGSHCDVCGEVLAAQQRTYATGHVEVIDEAVAGTCETNGLTAGKHCSTCGEVLVAQEVIPAEGHDIVIQEGYEATCSKAGLSEGRYCAACGEVFAVQETINKLGHAAVTVPAVAPTCTESGLTAGKVCSRCGMTIVKQTAVAATGHTETETPAVEPTCTKTGLTTGTHCGVCNVILVPQETVAKLGHTAVTVPAVAPTCVNTGLTAGKACSRCGVTIVKQTVVAATGVHTWGEGEITIEPTYETVGEMTYTCTVCDETKTEEIPKLEAPVVGKEYTYTIADGKVTITKVDVSISGDVVIPDTIEGYPVVAIGNNAFRDCVNMTSVTIPESVETIGQYAFKDCTALTTVYYNAKNCTSAGVNAYPVFHGCTALTTVYVGKSVESVPPRLFRAASALTTVYLTKNTKTIGANAFYLCDAITDVYFVGTAGD
ncbi:MAG: leucine-rich repeat domain-containing protein, partial [Ruminococcaceae bacterium]|nr:leucine-rich repeat domain-containing protein [Oscillospiraceae bacterium]